MSDPNKGRIALAAGGIGAVGAVLASTCCLGPLLLAAFGASGAWIAELGVLEPYRPLLLGVALIAIAIAWRRIYRPVRSCGQGEVRAAPPARTAYKAIFWAVSALALIALAVPYAVSRLN